MSRLLTSAFILACILLISCSTPYKTEGLMGGYSENQLNQNTYQVFFAGNGYTSRKQVNRYLIRRAAELTQQNGYKYFVVVGEDEQKKVSHFTTPTTVQSRSNTVYSSNGNRYQQYGSSSSYGKSVITPGHTYNNTRYENSIIIRMLKEPDPNQIFLDTDIILKTK